MRFIHHNTHTYNFFFGKNLLSYLKDVLIISGSNATCINLPSTLPFNQNTAAIGTDAIVVGIGKAVAKDIETLQNSLI